MRLTAPRRTPILIAAGVLALASVVSLLKSEFIERPEWMTYDWRVRIAQGRAGSVATNLGVVLMRDESIAAIKNGYTVLGTNRVPFDRGYGLYWPRQIYGRVVRELNREGVEAVAFDVMFGELRPDHSPTLMNVGSQKETDDPFMQRLIKSQHVVPVSSNQVQIESDDFFTLQLRTARNVALAATKDVIPPGLFRTNAMALCDITTERDSDGILRRAKAFRIYPDQWHQAFRQAAEQRGWQLSRAVVTNNYIIIPRADADPEVVTLDQDGNFDLADFVEKIPPGFARKNKPFIELRVWNLGFVLAARALGLDLDRAEVDLPHRRIVLRGTNGVQRSIPVDGAGWLYIDWELGSEDKRLTREPIEALVAKDFLRVRGQQVPDDGRWKGKFAVVGSVATGNDLTDRGATPLEEDVPLMTKHWNVANSIIQGHFVTRASRGVELAMIALLGIVSALLTWQLRTLVASATVTVAIIAYAAVAVWIYVQHRYWLPMVLPIGGGLLMPHVALVTYRVVFEQDEKRRVKSIFSRCVSPSIVNELLRAEQLSLEGTRREITILFADVRGFTELTDTTYERALQEAAERKLSPADTENYLDEEARRTLKTVNTYLGMLADIVKQHDGTFDKFIGDCVMAFWGAPTPQSRHAAACVRAAIDAQRAIFRLNERRRAENEQRERENEQRQAAGHRPLPLHPLLQMGSGVNTGPASVGLMGSDAHNINYTVFGREVNLASRLESVSGRGRIIIGETTFKHLQRDDPALAASCVAHAPITPKGFRNAIPVYEVPWQETGGAAPVAETPVKPDTSFEHRQPAPPATS